MYKKVNREKIDSNKADEMNPEVDSKHEVVDIETRSDERSQTSSDNSAATWRIRRT